MRDAHQIDQPYQCLKCLPKNVKYASKNGLTKHIARDHEKTLKKKWKCALCPKAFWSRQNLERHQRVHDKKKPYQCKHCGARFTLPHSVKAHILAVHLKVKDFHCSYCPKAFASKTALKGHLSAVHGDSVWARYECKECGKKFYEKQRYLLHTKNAHRPKDPIDEMMKKGICPIEGCDKRYKSKKCKESVKYHLVAFHKDRRWANYECKACDKLFYDKTSYRQHKEKKH